MTAPDRQDAIAQGLCMTCIAVLVPALFHHFAPLACWLTGACVLIAARSKQ